jgi:hypothetical protein
MTPPAPASPPPFPGLEGSVALVTGASRGIGRALCTHLARDSCDPARLRRPLTLTGPAKPASTPSQNSLSRPNSSDLPYE